MKITAIQTNPIVPGKGSLTDVLDEFLPALEESSVLVITSKIVSICEGGVVPLDSIDKEELIISQADKYLPAEHSQYGHHFTIVGHHLAGAAGIDESNGQEHYVLWPRDAQQTANQMRHYLRDRYGLKKLGIIISDSTSLPLQRGTSGTSLAHSGFSALKNYVGQPDIFGRLITVSQANIAGGLAAAAVLAMGEGAETTPLCLVTEASFVDFQEDDPSAEELAEINLSIEDDLFAPFLTAVDWHDGGHPA